MSFYTDVIKKSPKYRAVARCSDINLLEPGTRAAVAKLLVLAHEAGHELRVLETYRSQARQTDCYNRGASKLKTVGCHGFGVACDFQLLRNGKYDPVGEHYSFLQDMCRKVGLISGIDWGTPRQPHSFKDWDHVQRVPVFRQKALFLGTWYPPVNYDPYQDMKDNGVLF